MITIVLLVIIYLAFISLGLPDSLLGVAWPAIRAEWGMPLDAAGLVAMLAVGNTIISSFLSGHIIKKLGTGKIVFISCVMTGTALMGISFAPSYAWLLLLAIPLGFGGGSVDAALNNYVALNFKARHMNWLHSFWGVGATLGPVIMSQALTYASWRSGYRTISVIQLSLSVILLLSLPLWYKRKSPSGQAATTEIDETRGQKRVLKIRGVKYSLLTFLFYCAGELSVGLWGSSFLVQVKNLPVEMAASWVAMYYGGITLGRFISGFVSFRFSNTQMIRAGINLALAGTVLLFLPLPNFMLAGSFILIGLGFSPVFPSMIHETPTRFGKNSSQVIIGYQMAFGYMGSAFLPPLLGIVLKVTGMVALPFFLLSFILVMLLCSERLVFLTGKPVDVKQ